MSFDYLVRRIEYKDAPAKSSIPDALRDRRFFELLESIGLTEQPSSERLARMKPVFLGLLAFLLSLPNDATADAKLIFLGDMAVEREALSFPSGDVASLGAVMLKVQFWEDGVLPLGFAKDIPDEKRAQLLAACAEWSRVAAVRGLGGCYKGRSLAVTQNLGDCWSLAGMGANIGTLKRRMNLGKQCWSRRTLLHELGHAFGLIHEHQRPDRDHYIEILEENVEGGFLGLQLKVNFDKQGSEQKTDYDFHSIMHYGRKAFSKNGKDTILPKPQYGEYADVIGRANGISRLDAELMAQIYGTPKRP